MNSAWAALALVLVGCSAGVRDPQKPGPSNRESCARLEALARDEVVALGESARKWVAGTVEKSPANFRFDQVLDDNFRLHMAEASFDAAALKANFQSRYGSVPDLRAIELRKFRTVACAGDVVVLEFEERWIAGDRQVVGVAVTTVLRRSANSPGMTLLQLHETELP